jgi:hypothetical protein
MTIKRTHQIIKDEKKKFFNYEYVGVKEKQSKQNPCSCPSNSELKKTPVYETSTIKGQVVNGDLKGYRHWCICKGGYETSKNGIGQADNTCKYTGNYN